MDEMNAISVAICRHLGVDEDRVRFVRYEHEAGEIPTVTVEMHSMVDGKSPVLSDDGELLVESHQYEWKRA